MYEYSKVASLRAEDLKTHYSRLKLNTHLCVRDMEGDGLSQSVLSGSMELSTERTASLEEPDPDNWLFQPIVRVTPKNKQKEGKDLV